MSKDISVSDSPKERRRHREGARPEVLEGGDGPNGLGRQGISGTGRVSPKAQSQEREI